MTFKANTPERDEAIRKLAGELSAAIHGQHIDIAISAAALLIVAQCEPYKNADLDRYAATKLRQVADVMQPQWVPVDDHLPPDETPVLVLRGGAVRHGQTDKGCLPRLDDSSMTGRKITLDCSTACNSCG